MKEKPEDRLKRLRARKGVLLERMKSLRLSLEGTGPVIQNAEHKRSLINDELNRIGARILKIQGTIERKGVMMTRICPKCLETGLYSREQYCSQCGTKVIEVVFQCECGAELRPLFGFRIFPPWGRSLIPIPSRSYCTDCGRDVRASVKRQVKEMRRQWKGG